MPPRKSISSRSEPDSRKGKSSSRGQDTEIKPRPGEITERRPPPSKKGSVSDKTEMRPSPFADDEESPGLRTDARPSPFAEDEGGPKTDARPSPFASHDEAGGGSPVESWEAPPGRMSREVEQVGAIPAGQADDESYHTGPNYPVADEPDEEPSPPEEDGEREEGGTVDLESESEDESADDSFEPLEDHDLGPPRSKTQTRVAVLAEQDGAEEEEAEDDSEATRAGPPIKIKIIAGPDAGKTKRFAGVRMVIGRTAGCELKLSDQSVSRRHLELVRGENGVLLRDLGSGNGTRVNGEKVTERLLQHDDEVSLGKTKFLYVDEMAAYRKLREAEAQKKKEEDDGAEAAAASEPAAESAEAEGTPAAVKKGGAAAEGNEKEKAGAIKRASTPEVAAVPRRRVGGGLEAAYDKLEPKQRLMAVGGAGGVLLLVIVLVLVVATREKPPPPPDPRIAQAAEKMQLARDAVRAERYEDAVKLVEQAEKILPGSDTEGLLKRASAEMGAQKAVETIRGLISQGRFEDARAELARFPQASVKWDDQKKVLAGEIEKREAEYKAEQVESMLASGELDAARQLAAELPEEKRLEVAGKLAEAEEQAKQQARAEAARAAAVRAAKQRQAREQRQAEIEEAFRTVARKFHAGEYERAAAECDRVMDAYRGDAEIRERAKLLKKLIPSFGRNFEDGHKKFKANQLAASVRPLRKARELYQQIGFQGALGEQIDEELAAAALAAGRDALARDDLATAAASFRDAARLDPSDPRAKDGLERIAAKADEVYTAGYMIRDRDPREAISKFKLVLQIAPEGSPVYEKAKRQLVALEPTTP